MSHKNHTVDVEEYEEFQHKKMFLGWVKMMRVRLKSKHSNQILSCAH